MSYVALGELISKAKVEKCGSRSFPVLSMTMHDGIVFQNDRFKKDIASIDRSNYSVVNRNQLVVSFPIDEGVLDVQDITDAGIVSPAYKIWDIDQSMVVPKYLETWLRSPRSIEYYKSKLRGTTARRRSIPENDFLTMPVLVPSYKVQLHAVDLINRVKQIIQKREQQLSALDNLIKARFVEMFGEPQRNHAYSYCTVSELTDVVSGGTPDRKNADYWEGGTIPWIKTTELQNTIISKVDEYITEKGLSESSAKMLPSNTILIAMYGQGKTRGMTGYLGIEACTNQACACLLPTEKVDMRYLWYFLILSYDELRGLAQGGNQPNLNAGMIKSFPVLVPPLSKQKQFVSFVSQIDKSKFAVQKSLEETQKLFDSLMQQYFG